MQTPQKPRQRRWVAGRGGACWDPLGSGWNQVGQNPHLLMDPRGAEPKPPGREQLLIKLTRDCLVNICLPLWPPGATEEKQLAVNKNTEQTVVCAKEVALRATIPWTRGLSVRRNASCGLQRHSALHIFNSTAVCENVKHRCTEGKQANI